MPFFFLFSFSFLRSSRIWDKTLGEVEIKLASKVYKERKKMSRARLSALACRELATPCMTAPPPLSGERAPSAPWRAATEEDLKQELVAGEGGKKEGRRNG